MQGLKLPLWWQFTVLLSDEGTEVRQGSDITADSEVVVRVDGTGPYTSFAAWHRHKPKDADDAMSIQTAFELAKAQHVDELGIGFTVRAVVAGEGVSLRPWQQVGLCLRCCVVA